MVGKWSGDRSRTWVDIWELYAVWGKGSSYLLVGERKGTCEAYSCSAEYEYVHCWNVDVYKPTIIDVLAMWVSYQATEMFIFPLC
jgi:hypothetical protein